jgi:hypothetical protein
MARQIERHYARVIAGAYGQPKVGRPLLWTLKFCAAVPIRKLLNVGTLVLKGWVRMEAAKQM